MIDNDSHDSSQRHPHESSHRSSRASTHARRFPAATTPHQPITGFTSGELHAARVRRNARGQKMTPTRIEQARAMHLSGRYTILEIAEHLGVSRSTVHRHLG